MFHCALNTTLYSGIARWSRSSNENCPPYIALFRSGILHCWTAYSRLSICFFQYQDLVAKEGNDRLKMILLLLAEEDEKTRFAAASALAILTSNNQDICKKIRTQVRRDARCIYHGCRGCFATFCS